MNNNSRLAASLVAAASAGLLCAAAAAHEQSEKVTPALQQAIPNIPGKSLTAVVVDYPPGAASPAHMHAKSAFIYAYVVSGSIESQVNDGPKQFLRAGESFYEPPGARHTVSRNASRMKPAKLLAVFVTDTGDSPLTTPAAESESMEKKQ
ncbi:quercetin dioxygenase-like cupin family protein [Variovorax beijingensis]|uniref:Quercetin dioxygenase-like cupin family protein n=2 Tax=Variovorax TaxID=34072 RepID=A0AAE3Y611_VARPD|nr:MULTISPECIES: cupin domain-containing protein [Variovorax]MDP9968610.1 quercetin dioxygenase-like cupin family protein [Variovorax paradoxus]MDR6430260.1 quercetin dioxygenase-like cupin family protein [Variovorax paradoxus]MDR6456241.1 quercetin dioxygenase-like cupin family protein [Variovorax paradoxus]TWD72385.1 quercetin dioxygenase-like cupin family protein [Variovorax beijingensis]